MNKRLPIIIRNTLACLLAGVVIYSASFCSHPENKKAAFLRTLDTAHHYLNMNDTVKYVGMKTCMLCHQDIYNTFIQTGMGKSFDRATRQKSSAKFGPHAVVYDSAKDFYYHPFWKNDSLYIMEFRMSNSYRLHHLPSGSQADAGEGDTIYKRIQQVNYIVGSGEHTNSHLYSVNGYLYQAPVTFYTQQGKWDLAPGFSGGFNSRFTREIGLECMTCHNSYPDFVKGSTDKYISVPNGISCERCHGPGALHVKAIQMGHITDTAKAIDYTIVNPAKLPVELQVDLCQRCHLQGNAVLKPGKSFYSFKPGMRLSEVMDVFLPKYEGMENEHIMASHAARLEMSQCFLQSLANGEKSTLLKPYMQGLTCVTCHNPHIDVRSVSHSAFNLICQRCHSPGAKNFCPELMKHTSDLRKSDSSTDCVGCHMPKGKDIDIPHVLTTDHYIRIPAPFNSPKAGITRIRKFITLYDANNPHPTPETRGRAYIQQYERFQSDYPALLDSAKSYFPDATPAQVRKNFQWLVYIAYLKNDWEGIRAYADAVGENFILDSLLVHCAYDNSDAITAYQIGEAYNSLSDQAKALRFYKRAVQLAPYEMEYRNKAASAQALLGQKDSAEKEYDYILHEDPQFVPALTNKGYLALLQGDMSAAGSYNARALALDPDNKQALLNTAQCYIFERNYKEAEQYLQLALIKYPHEEMIKLTLDKLKAISGGNKN